MKFKLILLLGVLIMFSTCKKETILSDGKEFDLELGYTVNINKGEFQINYNELIEDSRCPYGFYCLQAGVAKVKVIMQGQLEENSFEFSTLFPAKMNTIIYDGEKRYYFELLEINPNPSLIDANLDGPKTIKFELTEI